MTSHCAGELARTLWETSHVPFRLVPWRIFLGDVPCLVLADGFPGSQKAGKDPETGAEAEAELDRTRSQDRSLCTRLRRLYDE